MTRSLDTGEDLGKTLDRLVETFEARAAHYDRVGEIAFDNIVDLKAAGLLGIAVPRAYGGQGIGFRQVVEIIGRVAQGDPSTALILAMQYLQASAMGRSAAWPEPIRNEVFSSMVHDGALINGLRVEPELGTPARGGLPATTIHRDGDVWRLNGRKIYSTGSSALAWGVVWSRTTDEEPLVGGVLVPLNQPGVRIEKSWFHLGMRATGSDTIIFENIAVPDRYLVGLNKVSNPATGEAGIFASWFGVVTATIYDGVARAARNWLISFLKERTPSNLGQPLAALPRFHTLLGEIDALLLSNRALIDQTIAQQESGDRPTTEVGLLKHVVTENAIEAVSKAVAAIGNPGLMQTNPLERHYRNVLCGRIHTPQADVILAAAGRAALGV